MTVVSSDPEAMASETVTDEPSGHPLFPRAEHETGPDKRRIELIHVERLKEDGSWEACPRVFKATELRSWKDVVDLFGGGVYRARAQCAKTYQWQGTSERKEFAGSVAKPFIDEPKPKSASLPAAAPAAAPPPYSAPGWSAPPAPNGPPASYGPPGWAPPSPWGPPPGWMPPANSQDPPAWLALVLKMMDRPPPPPPPAQDMSILVAMFKANADRDAVLFRVLAERQATPLSPPAAPAGPNTLEVIRELKPLLESNTAPSQFREGIEVAKSLLQQTGGSAPPQEDFASTLATIMRTLSPAGMPGLSASPTVEAPRPAPLPPPAAPAPPPAPTLNFDDVIRMVARDRTLAQRFIEELRRAVPANDTTLGPQGPSAPPAPMPVTTTAAPRAASAPPSASASPGLVSSTPPTVGDKETASGIVDPSAARRPAQPKTGPSERSVPSALAPIPGLDDPDEAPSTFDGLALFQSPEVQEAFKGIGEEGRRRILTMFADRDPRETGETDPPGREP